MKFSIKNFFSKCQQTLREIYWRNSWWKTSFLIIWILLFLIAFHTALNCILHFLTTNYGKMGYITQSLMKEATTEKLQGKRASSH